MSEKNKILSQILSLYLVSSLIFLGYFFISDYNMKKDALINSEVKNLKEIKMGIYMKARLNGLSALSDLTRDKGVSACILSQNGRKIYSDNECALPKADIALLSGRVAIYEAIQNMKESAPDELSEAKILLMGKDISSELTALKFKTTLSLALALCALLFIGYHLARLALAPLYEKISALNRFIKDSTHEIKTPLSIIMMSIETADKSSLNERNLKRLNNINLAAKNLSQIYDDLVHLSFGYKGELKKELDLNKLITQRLEYFAPFLAKRKLNLSSNLAQSKIIANQAQMIKIIDNLLDNAIKYANLGGQICVNLSENSLSISNSGEGINKAWQEKIFERYTRFNANQGGFGIGLNLVKRCCEDNDILIKCESVINEKTTFTLSWQKA